MSQHVVIIGAVAAGPKSACRFKRLEPGSTVTMLDRSEVISYGGCGIPYFVSGDVSEAMQLRTTSFHMVRDAKFFKECKDVDAMTKVEATAIDRENKQVAIHNLTTGERSVLDYDQLVIATGAAPRRLNLEGEELAGVSYVSNPAEAVRIRDEVTTGGAQKAVVIGAGFIGLEMAEAFADMWGLDTTVIEIADQLMPHYISPALATMGQEHMRAHGVNFLFGESVVRFEGEDGHVRRVVTDKRVLDADVVIISVGVIPNDRLAREAGLDCSERGGILVDSSMRTSDPNIFAAGDCVVTRNQITDQPLYLPMGSVANRQGRVVGTNLAGGAAVYEGAVGAWVCKIFESSIAGAGMSLEIARKNGFDAMSVLLIQLDRAHFYPTKELMTLELVVDKGTRQILGVQGFGSAGDAMVGRVNAVAATLKYKPTIDDLSNQEMAYSPPFSSAIDIINTLANMADNALRGLNRGVGPDTFQEFWEDRASGKYFFLDCREAADASKYMEKHPDHWRNIPQGDIYKRIDEVPRDKQVILVCNTGARSYEAQIMLDNKGVANVINLHGGMAALKKWGGEP